MQVEESHVDAAKLAQAFLGEEAGDYGPKIVRKCRNHRELSEVVWG